MPLEAWRLIEKWFQQAQRWLDHSTERNDRTAAEIEPPNSDLVLAALQAGAIPGIILSSVRLVDGGAALLFDMPKPGGGLSQREMDVEEAVVSALLLFSGGRLFLDRSGDRKREFFYGRFSIYGSGDKAQPYVSRVVADTTAGTQTREGAKFHSWRRQEWSYRSLKEDDTGGKYGLDSAVRQAKTAFAKALKSSPSMMPPGLDEARFAEVLELAIDLMSRLPLKGQG